MVIWGEKCFRLWDAEGLEIAHVFRTDLVTQTPDRLLSLMIKAEPEGQYSGGRRQYEHINLTLILTVVPKHRSLKSKISKHTFKCIY